MVDSLGLPVASTRWHGMLSVQYLLASGRTYPAIETMVAPLKLHHPFYSRGSPTCQSVLLHTAGGIVGGDGLSVSVHLTPQTQVFWTTPSATKVYRSPDLRATTEVEITIEPGASLTWFPLETILFNGAKYDQRVRIELCPGGMWCGWDMIRLGRTAQGEGFDRGDWRSLFTIFSQGVPLWIDSQASFSSLGGLEAEYGLAGYPVVGTFCCFGTEVERSLLEQVRTLIPPSEPERLRFGVTRLPQGLVCRYRGDSTQEGKRWFLEVWRILNQYWGKEILSMPRVWPI